MGLELVERSKSGATHNNGEAVRFAHQLSGLNHSRAEDKREIKNHADDRRGDLVSAPVRSLLPRKTSM